MSLKGHCLPCKEGMTAIKGMPLMQMMNDLAHGWKLVQEHHIEKEFRFSDFRTALIFTNRVGELAEVEGHHPEITLGWGHVKVIFWTHKVDGLTENDFIMAAKCEEEFSSMKVSGVCF